LQALRDAVHTAPEVRNFHEALKRKDRIRLLAEVKKASPSKGVIRPQFHPVDIARAYEAGGAAAISVLTDEPFFQGKLDYLTHVRESVSIPILRKDFILDEYQIVEARVAGADAVLLIAECLPGEALQDLYSCIRELGMTALIELYDPIHLDRVLATGSPLVGVNNRDLRTFAVDLDHVIRLRSQIPASVTLVAESGISHPDDVRRLEQAGIDAILVGESLMRQHDVRRAVEHLMQFHPE
ncbi:MAG: indole-3-glycerol phosphate synthase TrpC, partial [Planctomycetota bacterium]